jgi:hypothetical protein
MVKERGRRFGGQTCVWRVQQLRRRLRVWAKYVLFSSGADPRNSGASAAFASAEKRARWGRAQIGVCPNVSMFICVRVCIQKYQKFFVRARRAVMTSADV